MPQSKVIFTLGGAEVGRAQLDGNGVATLTLSGLPQGEVQIMARFEGNESWAACESPALTLFVGVEPPPPTFGSGRLYLPLLGR